MHKGIPVEYCSGSGKYANLFGVSLSTAERLAYQHAGCVGRHGIAITHQSGRRFSVKQADKSLLPVSCFSVAWDNWGIGFDDANIALEKHLISWTSIASNATLCRREGSFH